MRRTVSLILTLALVFLLFSPVSALTHPPIYVSGADAYVLIDAKSGTVLASYEGDKKIYPASTTKILTAIVALEKGSLDMKMTASVAAVHDIGKDGMNIGIQAGEVMTMEDLLNAMLVVSANETANIIAENICETRQEFMDLCNQKAAEIGATDTHYTNPCGMHEDSHYTTAMDLAKIARHAMQNEVFRSIVRKTSIQLSPTNKHSSWNTLYTSNILLRSNNFEGYEITGIKSGYTDPAGRCLITSARNHAGEELIAVVMGVRAPNSGEVITDITTKLFEYGFNNFKSLNLVRKNVYLGLHSVENARDNMPLVLVAQEDLDVFTLASLDLDKVEVKLNINAELELPVKANDPVGTADYYYENELLGSVDIAAGNNVYAEVKKDPDPKERPENPDDMNEPSEEIQDDEKSVIQKILQIGKIVIVIVGALLLVYLFLALMVNIQKRKRNGRRRRNP